MVGVPDEVLGEKVCACIVVSTGEQVTLESLNTFLLGHKRIARYKLPEYFLALEALPRNPVGKILKRELREQAKALFPASLKVSA